MTMLTRIAMVILSIIMMSRGNSLTENYQLCNLQCTNEEGAPVSLNIGLESIVIGTGVHRKLAESDQEYRQLQLQMSKINETLLETRDVLKKIGNSGNIDCKNLLDAGNTVDGVYTIIVDWSPVQVLCDMVGGGWTVFQHRFNGSVDFRRNFQSYTRGFGNPNSEFWLGLENIHKMTSNGQWMLQINMERFHGETAYAQYKDFKLNNGSRYELAIGAYSGTAGDELSYVNGAAFSTYDMDQDTNVWGNCAGDDYEAGAWWLQHCGHVNLNSYKYKERIMEQGMYWYHFDGSSEDDYIKMTMMKMMKV